VESGEGIERHEGRSWRHGNLSRVESGEGIERTECPATWLFVVCHVWNPVKELKAGGVNELVGFLKGPWNPVKELKEYLCRPLPHLSRLLVESGEGIESIARGRGTGRPCPSCGGIR